MSNFNLTPKIISGGTFNVEINNDQKQLVGKMGVVNATSNNYNDLSNKPSINGVILVGNKTGAELGIVNDKNFVYAQATSSDIWEITHNLNKYPAVTVVDSGGSVVIGEIVYIDKNNIRITFASAFSGKAYFN